MIRSFIALAFGLAVFSAPVQAQTPAASPTPKPTPFSGFSAHGTIAAHAQIGGSPIAFGTEIAVASSERRVRIDLLRVSFSGDSPSMNAMIARSLPTSPVALVYDQAARTATVWSEATRTYYRTIVHMPSGKHPSSPKETVTDSPIDQFLRATKSLTEFDTLNQAVTLVGHQPVNGHLSTVLHVTLESQKHGGKLQHIGADLALADDLSGFPIRLWMTGKGEFEGDLKIDLATASFARPDPSVFKVPSGYKRVDSFMLLFGVPVVP